MTFEDLPLFPEAEPSSEDPADPGAPPAARRPLANPPSGRGGAPSPPAVSEPPPPLVPQPRYQLFPARFGQRLGSLVFDLAALAAVGVGAALGATVLGVEVSLAEWPPLALFVTVFSFLYATVPLAFWGRTPGMAAVGLVARSPGNRPLTFRQAFIRWLCGIVTVALAGLPALLSLTGSSLADRASGSATLSRR